MSAHQSLFHLLQPPLFGFIAEDWHFGPIKLCAHHTTLAPEYTSASLACETSSYKEVYVQVTQRSGIELINTSIIAVVKVPDWPELLYNTSYELENIIQLSVRSSDKPKQKVGSHVEPDLQLTILPSGITTMPAPRTIAQLQNEIVWRTLPKVVVPLRHHFDSWQRNQL
ncbi:hypothetical protein BDP27DRAFT_1369975 [Rhodocollybia butyracea]|uniref:Uncharacterized protein n=1 Tax=Rhodocollybia butyracea TaxID=206335 RepID=A0A9P5U088_9AGAR|nr:hypothetical protein BDP27DRAFT_1369975 [Rhodocollybia butyracea]